MTLSPQTKTTLATLATVVACALYLDRRMASAESARERGQAQTQFEFQKLDIRLTPIEALAREAASQKALQGFRDELAEENPTIRVPRLR